jgi:hypothetical protein
MTGNSSVINVHGLKKLSTLKREFSAKFPYLSLGIYAPEAKELVAQGQKIYSLSNDHTISEVRTRVNPGEISIHGRKKVSTLEREFEDIYGLYTQVCFVKSDGKRFYTTGSLDDMTLSSLNRKGEEDGWKEQN